MFKIKRFVFSPFGENTYVIWDDDSKEAMIIDPGCADKEEEAALQLFIEDEELIVKYLVNTHCHLDHIFGNHFVKTTFGAEFLAPEKDIPLLEMAPQQAEMFGVEITPSPMPDAFITGETEIAVGPFVPKMLFTPGHTPGEYCLYFENERVCVTGDVLFRDSIGRTDLWGGDMDALLASIREKLLTLPEEVVIYPGHGEESTIRREKQLNPFLQ